MTNLQTVPAPMSAKNMTAQMNTVKAVLSLRPISGLLDFIHNAGVSAEGLLPGVGKR